MNKIILTLSLVLSTFICTFAQGIEVDVVTDWKGKDWWSFSTVAPCQDCSTTVMIDNSLFKVANYPHSNAMIPVDNQDHFVVFRWFKNGNEIERRHTSTQGSKKGISITITKKSK